jgi:CRISPR-associated exonuclease Cas4
MLISLFDERFRISGESFFDFFSCKTRLWLESRNIDGDFDSNEHIKIGKFIDESTFKRERSTLLIPGICSLDFIKTDSGILEIHEVKKGKKVSKPQIMQTMYYIYILNEITGKKCTGFLHIPEIRKKVEITLNIEFIKGTILKISEVINHDCPKPELKPICRGCSYRNMCWG